MIKFFEVNPEAFGLEITDTTVKVLKLGLNQSKFSIDSFNITNLKPGVVDGGIIKDEKALSEVIRACIKEVNGKKLTIPYVVAALPESQAFIQVIPMPKMTAEELKTAIIFEVENYIPLAIEEVYIDFEIIGDNTENDDHIDVLVAACPKKIVDGYLTCLRKAKLEPLALEIKSLATARTLAPMQANTPPIAIIDFDEMGVDFIVIAQQSIQFTYAMPFSLKSLQENNQSFDELIIQIKKHIDFYEGHGSHEHKANGLENSIKKIILTGQGAKIKDLPSRLSQSLSISTEVANPIVNLPLIKEHSLNPADFLPFTAVIGLAIRALGRLPVKAKTKTSVKDISKDTKITAGQPTKTDTQPTQESITETKKNA